MLNAERAQALAGGELDEAVYQVKRIGDFPEPNQRSGIRELGESASIAHGQKNECSKERNDQQIGRAEMQARERSRKDGDNGSIAVKPEPLPVIAECEVQQRCRARIPACNAPA